MFSRFTVGLRWISGVYSVEAGTHDRRMAAAGNPLDGIDVAFGTGVLLQNFIETLEVFIVEAEVEEAQGLGRTIPLAGPRQADADNDRPDAPLLVPAARPKTADPRTVSLPTSRRRKPRPKGRW